MRPNNQVESLISHLHATGERHPIDSLENTPTGFGCVFNTESAWFYLANTSFQQYVNQCNHIYIDGSALSLALKICGARLPRNHGPDVMRELSIRGDYDAIILVGGSSESHKEIKEGRTKLSVDDVFPLPQLESDPAIDDIIEPLKSMIRRYQGRNLILVSLGLPKQELFCRKLMDSGIFECNKDFILPVGAAIDFATGRRVRSSQVWTNLGLEWLPRLLREPRMLPRIYRSLRAVYYILVSQITRAK